MTEWIRNIVSNEGLRAFYKGTLSPLSGIAACTSILYGTNEYTTRLLIKHNKEKKYSNHNILSIPQLIFWGMSAGAANSIVVSPVEHIRIVMQVQTNKFGVKGEFSGSYDALSKIYNWTIGFLWDLKYTVS